MIWLLIILEIALYCVVGFMLGATVFRRPGASWKSYHSNAGEFVMLLGPIGGPLFLWLWPPVVAIQLMVLTVGGIRRARNKKIARNLRESDKRRYQASLDLIDDQKGRPRG